MNNIYIVENVLLKKNILDLYNNLISNSVWDLNRKSNDDVKLGAFPGFSIKDDNNVFNPYWFGYFQSLFENIHNKFYEKYKFTLPFNIKRIHLGAKNDSSITNFHCDINDANAYTIVGFLTPEWDLNWKGQLMVEENVIDFTPGKFVIFKSNLRHNGIGTIFNVPFWRITVNFIIQ
jgi:hypothetical protein